MTTEGRIRALVREDPNTGCWIWTGSFAGSGYPTISVGGRKQAGHRVAYEAFIGPIPEGLELDHLCSTPTCVNPAHLEPVTHTENVLRGRSFAAVNARKSHCVNGHLYDARNTYRRPNGRRDCRVCINQRVRRYKARQEIAA